MKQTIARTPLPLAGLMLGFATLGNVLGGINPAFKTLCGIVSTIALIMVVLKLLLQTAAVREDFANPLIATTFATFDMGLMVLSTYLKPYAPTSASLLWWLGIVLHVVNMAYVTFRFVRSFDLKKIFPSYFITYVGIAVASVTAPAFSQQALGQVLFYISFVLYLVWLVVILYRLAKLPPLPEPARPSLCILAAPGSLCLAGYLGSFGGAANTTLVGFLAILATVMTFVGYWAFFRTNGKPFYPTYAAYTFPFAISALAAKRLADFLAAGFSGGLASIVLALAWLEIAAAVLSCVYALVRYSQHIFQKQKQAV